MLFVPQATAFVPQADCLLPALTVAETVTCSARLRLPQSASNQQVLLLVSQQMQDLELSAVAHRLVGGGGGIRGLSGGERRRVSIATELVSGKKLLIMDEPTSGLDSYAALQLLRTCRQASKRGGGGGKDGRPSMQARQEAAGPRLMRMHARYSFQCNHGALYRMHSILICQADGCCSRW